MNLHESGENYLETILILSNKNDMVRCIDIARELGFSKPSVSRAVALLKKAEYINVEESGNVILTDSGRLRAEQIYERHNILTAYLIKTLNVDKELASIDACRIEHVISDEVFLKIKEYVLSKQEIYKL